MSENAIIPVEQKQIEFHGDIVTAVVALDGTVYVPVRPLCELIGLDWDKQRKRITEDVVLGDVVMGVSIANIQIESAHSPYTTQDMICLPLRYLNGWLLGINVNDVDESVRDNLISYQHSCYNILHDESSQNTNFIELDTHLMKSDSPQGEAYRIGLEVAELARKDYHMEARRDT